MWNVSEPQYQSELITLPLSVERDDTTNYYLTADKSLPNPRTDSPVAVVHGISKPRCVYNV